MVVRIHLPQLNKKLSYFGEIMTKLTAIKAYVASKGIKHPKGTDLDAIKAQLVKEYGFLTNSVKGVTTAEVKTLSLKDIRFNRKHFNALQERSPKGKSLALTGVVLKRDNGFYLIDGHHRLKWALNRDYEVCLFIVLS